MSKATKEVLHDLEARQTVLPPLAPRAVNLRYALPALGLALASLAGAQSTDAAQQLTEGAKSQMASAIPLIVGLLVTGIGITIAFFINKNAKKGIKSAG